MTAPARASAALLLVLLTTRGTAQAGGGLALEQGRIIGGGGTSRSGGLVLDGTVGQVDAGQLRGGSFRLQGGLWPALFDTGVPRCAGDCGGDGQVTVDELVTMVGISIAGATTAPCESGDGNGDGRVSVDELIAAVNQALATCA